MFHCSLLLGLWSEGKGLVGIGAAAHVDDIGACCFGTAGVTSEIGCCLSSTAPSPLAAAPHKQQLRPCPLMGPVRRAASKAFSGVFAAVAESNAGDPTGCLFELAALCLETLVMLRAVRLVVLFSSQSSC